MSGETTIRDAQAEDRPALAAMMAALQDFERAMEANRVPGAECGESHIAALEAWAAETGGGVLIATRAGAAVGFLVYGVSQELGTYIPEETRSIGEISDLYVAPDARGAGVAAALVAAAEARLAAQGLRRVEISALVANAPARAAFSALGYRETYVGCSKRIG